MGRQIGNRPFAQLLSGLATGHPAAAGPSPAFDFSVFDEQKVVFLLSVLDCSECDSSGLDYLNSSWSIAHLREYFRRKIGHSWTARKPSLNGKSRSIHRHLPQYTLRLCDCSQCDSSDLDLDFRKSSLSTTRVKEYLRGKKDTIDWRSRKLSFVTSSIRLSIKTVTSHTHCVYTPAGALPNAT